MLNALAGRRKTRSLGALRETWPSSRVRIPSVARIGAAGRDTPAVRCGQLANECSIAHRRRSRAKAALACQEKIGTFGQIPRSYMYRAQSNDFELVHRRAVLS